MKQALVVAILATGSIFFAGCSDDVNPTGPTGPSSVPMGGASALLGDASASTHGSAPPGLGDTTEVFVCDEIGEVRVRFSDPGYAHENTVGLFTLFADVPSRDVRLRIWWDHENDGTTHEDVALDDEDVRRLGEGTFQIEKLAEHVYPNVAMATERRVRVELIIDGREGSCSRNRTVTLLPPSTSGPVAGPPPGCYANVNPGFIKYNGPRNYIEPAFSDATCTTPLGRGGWNLGIVVAPDLTTATTACAGLGKTIVGLATTIFPAMAPNAYWCN